MISGPNWARRYGPSHRRLCARPGCGAPAAATLRFLPTQREAWLVALDEARTEGDLCARHAAGLVLPRGWQLHNDLTGDHATTDRDPNAPAPPVRRPRSTSIARTRRRRTANSAVALPGLGAIADPAPQPRPEPATYPERDSSSASAREPGRAPLVAEATPETSEALAETLDAQTPLLRRAFDNVLPKENDS
ncbi:MAG: DUF3499 family protein [Actinomycetota bacterium]|nr:DUF3499 family protein [Actinomycetota bacterium]